MSDRVSDSPCETESWEAKSASPDAPIEAAEEVNDSLADEYEDEAAALSPVLHRAENGLRRSMTALTFFVLWLLVSVVGPFAHAQGAVSLPTGLILLSLYSVFTAAIYLGLSWRVWTILRGTEGQAGSWLPLMLVLGVPAGIFVGLLSSRLPVAICFGTGIAFAAIVATDAVLQLVCRNRLMQRIEAAKRLIRGARTRTSKASGRPAH